MCIYPHDIPMISAPLDLEELHGRGPCDATAAGRDGNVGAPETLLEDLTRKS